MTDHPDKKGKPGKENAFVYIGDERSDGHPLYLHVVVNENNPGSELVRASGAIAKRNFSTIFHGRSLHYLKERSKVVVLRPAALKKEAVASLGRAASMMPPIAAVSSKPPYQTVR